MGNYICFVLQYSYNTVTSGEDYMLNTKCLCLAPFFFAEGFFFYHPINTLINGCRCLNFTAEVIIFTFYFMLLLLQIKERKI